MKPGAEVYREWRQTRDGQCCCGVHSPGPQPVSAWSIPDFRVVRGVPMYCFEGREAHLKRFLLG